MRNCIGIRKETKDKTQSRAPLAPHHVKELIEKHGIKVLVRPWDNRIFNDEEYVEVGAVLSDDISESNIIFGIKEISPEYLLKEQTYCFFSHTMKGQTYNMPMLQMLIDNKCTLFDYELVKNKDGKRLIFFGDYAGYAGMIDSVWALGKRLDSEGVKNPFNEMSYATEYKRLKDAENAFLSIGEKIKNEGLPEDIVPFVCAFTGYGHVSKAAQKLFDLFPIQEIEPKELESFMMKGKYSNKVLYKVQFRKPDMFEKVNEPDTFDLEEFNLYPEIYKSKFERFVKYISMIINGIYWEERYPRLLSKKFMKELYRTNHKLKVVGDITCDIDGSIELTVKTTDANNPVFVYEPLTDKVVDGWVGNGPVVLAVEKLPTELPWEASRAFGDMLMPFVPQLAKTDYSVSLEQLNIPNEFKDAMILYQGKLMPKFEYLKDFLKI